MTDLLILTQEGFAANKIRVSFEIETRFETRTDGPRLNRPPDLDRSKWDIQQHSENQLVGLNRRQEGELQPSNV